MTTRQMATSGTAHTTLKRFYDNNFQRLYTEWFELLDWLKGKGRIKNITPEGEKIYFGVEYLGTSSVGPRGEMVSLPTADVSKSVQGSVDYLKGFKGRMQISAESLKFAKKGKGAFTSAMQQETRAMIAALKSEGAAALWGDGGGVLAKTTAQVSSSTAVVPVTSEISTGYFPGTRWLREAGRVDCWSESGGDFTADGSWTHTTDTDKIMAINSDNSFTVGTANDTAAAADRYWSSKDGGIKDTGTGSNVFYGPQGMLAMVDDGTLAAAASYCNILESTYHQWKGVVSDNAGTGRALTIDKFYRHYLKMARKAGKMDTGLTCWTNPDLHLEVVDLLEHFVQFKPRELKGGFNDADISVHGHDIKFKLDFMAPGAFMFLNPKSITVAEGVPIEVVDEDGRDMQRVANYDAFEMRWRWIINTYTTKRNDHGILADINYTVSSV
ncbi:MAG: phage major capsid protein [Deltaproteobacteria bacterium]|nr:phage major capsid protein [Deltaproteobacteria bacterium]